MATSRLVKHGSAEAPRAVAFHFDDIARQAELDREAVRRQTEGLLGAARTKAKALLEAAHREGYRGGYHEGREQAEREHDARVEREVAERLGTLTPLCQQVIDKLEADRERWQVQWETAAMRLACTIAGRIVKGEVKRDSKVVRRIVAEALSLAGGSPKITLRLSPADAESLGSPLPAALAPVEQVAKVEVVADETISPGGCVVETEHGIVDARIETQLRRIEKELAGD